MCSKISCFLDGALGWSEGTWPWSSQLFWARWAWVGQVDLFLTNVGPERLCLGLTIEVKVIGKRKLKEGTDMVRFCMHFKGEINLRSDLN